MPLHWSRHIRAWAHVARQHAGLASGITMLRAVLSGPVPADAWRDRLKVCLRCPILDRETMACRRVMSDGSTLGCNCAVVFLALTAAPYPKGCYARQRLPHEGWGAFHFPTFRARLRAIFKFIFP